MPYEAKKVTFMTTINDLMSLKDRRALVTGATGGLGRAISDTLAELGADLILIDRPGSDFDSLVESLSEQWGCDIDHKECDLEQQRDRADLMDWVVKDHKDLNILINNAAFVGASNLQGWIEPFEDQSIETWRRAIEVNLTAVFDLCQGLLSALNEADGASIINIASIYGEFGPDWRLYEGTKMGNPAAYAVSKGGLIQFTRWLATTLAPNVRVNAVSPGGVFKNQPENFITRYEERTPMGRMATEDDFRGVVAYLASDMSKYVTGQNLFVDGGWGVW